MMENLEQLQVVVREVQAARQQVATIRAQVQELEATLDAIKNQPEDLALHKQMGGILVEVSDRKELQDEIQTSLDTLKEHSERFSQREAQLVATYEELKKVLEGSQ